jgi:hypothetical protein
VGALRLIFYDVCPSKRLDEVDDVSHLMDLLNQKLGTAKLQLECSWPRCRFLKIQIVGDIATQNYIDGK